MRTLALGAGAAAATFVALFAMSILFPRFQSFPAVTLFLGAEALLVGSAIWLGRNWWRMPERIAVSAIVSLLTVAAFLFLLMLQPIYMRGLMS